jgi:hypothetical protein
MTVMKYCIPLRRKEQQSVNDKKFGMSKNRSTAALQVQAFISDIHAVNRMYGTTGMPSLDRQLIPKELVRFMKTWPAKKWKIWKN